MIPRLFHQIWLGPQPFPKEFKSYQRTWLEQNPGWELRLWTEDDLPDDLTRPEIRERLRQPAERSDMLRLELLHRHGGVYLDTDFEAVRPLEPLLEGVTVFCARLNDERVNNAIIGSVPAHPLFARAIEEVRPRDTYGPVDKEGTGPFFFDRLVRDFPEVTVFDPELFYPKTPETQASAVAVHHSHRSWKAPELLLVDAQRAEAKLGRARDEVRRIQRKYDAALAEIDALRARSRGERGARVAALRARLSRLLP